MEVSFPWHMFDFTGGFATICLFLTGHGDEKLDSVSMPMETQLGVGH